MNGPTACGIPVQRDDEDCDERILYSNAYVLRSFLTREPPSVYRFVIDRRSMDLLVIQRLALGVGRTPNLIDEDRELLVTALCREAQSGAGTGGELRLSDNPPSWSLPALHGLAEEGGFGPQFFPDMSAHDRISQYLRYRAGLLNEERRAIARRDAQVGESGPREGDLPRPRP